MFNDAHREAFLKLLFTNAVAAPYDGTAFGAAGTTLTASTTAGGLVVALHTDDPGSTGTQTTNEISYTGYARVEVARSAGGWTYAGGPPVTISNTAEVSFGQRTDNGAAVVATHFSIGGDTTGAGDIFFSGPLGIELSKPFACWDIATNDDLVVPGHGYSNDDQVVFVEVAGDALPTGITEGTVYYVIAASGDTSDKIRVSATQGGAAVAISAVGSGRIARVVSQSITKNTTPKFAAGSLVVQPD